MHHDSVLPAGGAVRDGPSLTANLTFTAPQIIYSYCSKYAVKHEAASPQMFTDRGGGGVCTSATFALCMKLN